MKPATGAQLWSLRNVLLQEPETTLEKLATAGYSVVEPAGFNIDERTIQGFKPKDLKSLADSHGLRIISGHFQLDVNTAPAVCDYAAQLGMKYFVVFNLRDELKISVDSYKTAANELNKVGEIARAYGIKVGYHNHAHEFSPMGGVLPFDILLDYTDPELVVFQPDLGWMGLAGQDPVKIFERFPGRFPLWHFRDIDVDTKKSTAIGSGMIDFAPVIANQSLAGLEYAIVEMASDAEDPLGKILSSHKTIEKLF
ncbi:sugar phosphate isomerase/epimerase family protein [Niabella hibiscisoli]|uniref:sugar phosphate isomerase/epimerase family protein n=1 Tax=Niabella hibiscisoli TaxID=1825928 RepID=UPI001F0ED97E|nr:sugar phosphate isomerase/epimerase [Niabella hibiscisoli]MCH5715087.1 sugar phosphate isomerase/epimerase [Niabella hibiscisoli]